MTQLTSALDLPPGWKQMRLKFATSYLSRGNSPTYSEESSTRVINQACVFPSSIKFENVKFEETEDISGWKGELWGGEVLVNSTGTGTLGRVGYLPSDHTLDGRLLADGHVTIVRGLPEVVDQKFLFYYLSTRQDEITAKCSEGATNQIELGRENFSSFLVTLPPVAKQREIVAYLDRETDRIDELVVGKEKMLALLQEKRSTLIARIVRCGLYFDAELKESGVEWLGDIPSGWLTQRAKHLFQVRDERSQDGSEELLTVSHLTGVTPRSDKVVYMFMAKSLQGYKKCKSGDLVINTLWAWMGAMGVAQQDGVVSPDYHVYAPGPRFDPAYIDYLCRSKPFIAEVNRHSKGVWSSRLRLYPEAFFRIVFPVPPKEEQKDIVAHLDRELSESNRLENALRKSIELLNERRTVFITAAVTGRIEVPDRS